MRRAYTLIEFLTTLAALVILLGLMMTLARFVRHRSAEDSTRELLSKLERLLAQYSAKQDELDASVPGLMASAKPDEAALDNNQAFVRFFNEQSKGQAFSDLPLAFYDGTTLHDAWGMPVVYVAAGSPTVGMMRTSRPFFFSAGPDRQYATVLDNQYSYDRSYEKPAGQRE